MAEDSIPLEQRAYAAGFNFGMKSAQRARELGDRMIEDGVTVAEAVEALRALNKAIWLTYPQWAVVSAETGRASEVIAKFEWEQKRRAGSQLGRTHSTEKGAT